MEKKYNLQSVILSFVLVVITVAGIFLFSGNTPKMDVEINGFNIDTVRCAPGAHLTASGGAHELHFTEKGDFVRLLGDKLLYWKDDYGGWGFNGFSLSYVDNSSMMTPSSMQEEELSTQVILLDQRPLSVEEKTPLVKEVHNRQPKVIDLGVMYIEPHLGPVLLFGEDELGSSCYELVFVTPNTCPEWGYPVPWGEVSYLRQWDDSFWPPPLSMGQRPWAFFPAHTSWARQNQYTLEVTRLPPRCRPL